MNRINRRRFVAVTSVAATGAVLVACGNEPADETALNPTQIPDVPGAPPTLAPITGTPGAEPAEDTEEEATGNGGAAEAITITMHDDFSFDPDQPEVSPGQTVTVVNEGFMQHDLVSDELGISTALLNNGESEDIVIPEDAAVGESYHFICTVAGHEQSGMVGDFNIVEAGEAAATEEEPAEEEEESTEEEGAAAGAGEPITITMHDDFSFDPDQPEVSPGQTVTVVNEGFMQHDLVSDDLGIGTALLNNGESEDIVIPEDAAVGESYHFICTVAGHEQSGMVGDFNIVEGGGEAAATEEEEPAEDEEATAAATAEEDTDDEAAAAGAGEPITITMHDDFSFDPDQPEVSPGQTVTVVNEGFMQHDLVSDDLGIGTALLNNGESEDIVIPEDAAVGESYHFICTVAGHEQSGMVGDFNIVEGGGEAAATEEEPAEEEPVEDEEDTGDEAAAPAGGAGEPITITMHDDFSFDPDQPEVSPGQIVTVVNEGFMQHDLVSDDLGIGTALLNNGESEDIVIPEDAAIGEQFHFICTVAGHEQSGMVGDFNIVEGGGEAAAADEDAAEEESADEDAAAADEEASPAAVEAPTDNDPMASTVIGTQWQFTPAEFEMAPGGVLTWQNDTDMMMGLSAEEWNDGDIPIIRSIGAGETAEFTIPEDAEVGSTVEFTSNLTEAQNQGMVGTITIVEGDGAVASPVASPAATPESDDEEDDADNGASGDAIVIEGADDFSFSPDQVEVSPGQTVTFTNVGYMQHDLVCEDLGIGTELLNTGESEDLVIPDDAEVGESYHFICTVAGHEQSGMVGDFIIV